MSAFGSGGSKAEEILEQKLAYYKNLKPRVGVFKTQSMDPTQKILQEAHEKNKAFIGETAFKKLGARKTLEEHEEDIFAPPDEDVQQYRELRAKYKGKKMKTNLDLIEQFNETALKFIPLYQKRVDQQDFVDKMIVAARRDVDHEQARNANQVVPGTVGRHDDEQNAAPSKPPPKLKGRHDKPVSHQ